MTNLAFHFSLAWSWENLAKTGIGSGSAVKWLSSLGRVHCLPAAKLSFLYVFGFIQVYFLPVENRAQTNGISCGGFLFLATESFVNATELAFCWTFNWKSLLLSTLVWLFFFNQYNVNSYKSECAQSVATEISFFLQFHTRCTQKMGMFSLWQHYFLFSY